MLARTKVLWIVLCAVTLVAGFGLTTAQADFQTWDALDGWHTDTNTSSNLWQYMRAGQDGVNGDYTLLPNYYAAGEVAGVAYDAWWYGTPTLPVVGSNGSEILAHPALPDAGVSPDAVIAWMSPISGIVNASFSLTDRGAALPADDGVNYHLFKSGVSTALSSGIVANGGSSGMVNVYNVGVSTGDMLYLQIGCGAQVNGDEDLTGVSFSVTAVPEPTSLALLMIGLIGLLGYAWNKRK